MTSVFLLIAYCNHVLVRFVMGFEAPREAVSIEVPKDIPDFGRDLA